MDIFQGLNDRGMTIIMVTHDTNWRCDSKQTKNNARRIIRIIQLDSMSIKLCV
jgi:ABC-type ATPase involved in cell division